MKICSKTQQIALFNFWNSAESMPSNPLSKRVAMPRAASCFAAYATRSAPQKVGPPWQILHTPIATTKEFISGDMRS